MIFFRAQDIAQTPPRLKRRASLLTPAFMALGLMAFGVSGCSTTGQTSQTKSTTPDLSSTKQVAEQNTNQGAGQAPDQSAGQNSSQNSGGPIYSPLPDAGPQKSTSSDGVKTDGPSSSAPIDNIDIYERLSAFQSLQAWELHDPRPALASFKQSCALWAKRDPQQAVSKGHPEYGRYQDWAAPCFSADYVPHQGDNGAYNTRLFFETYFQPVSLSTQQSEQGLLTGYYVPEIEARRRPDDVYYEPILRVPQEGAARSIERKNVKAAPSQIIAYGKPVDVFFMQVQGSGRLIFDDGARFLAAFAAHNGQPYSSIGKELVDRGQMTLEQASKQSIEAWMARHSQNEVRALMNVNARYVYFQEEEIIAGRGPNGAMGVPLEAMGSLAIDSRYHPYGALIWLETTLPQKGSDYKGEAASLLVSAQDTGGAIKGALRGDLFFGTGAQAGDLAGVMKHDAGWTLFLPTSLANQYLTHLARLDRDNLKAP